MLFRSDAKEITIDTTFEYHVFDILQMEEWNEQRGLVMSDRRNQILKIFFDRHYGRSGGEVSCQMKWVRSNFVASMDQIDAAFQAELEAGGEGLIIKDLGYLYQFERSRHWRKLKNESTLDMRVIEVVEGNGKFEGMLGAVRCETDDGKVTVKVGSGFKQEERISLWAGKECLIGRVVEVKYNTLIRPEGSEELSLFLPVFKGVRADKDTANTFEEIPEKDKMLI